MAANNKMAKRIADRTHLLKQISNARKDIYDLQVTRLEAYRNKTGTRDENIDLAVIEMLEAKIAWAEAELQLLD